MSSLLFKNRIVRLFYHSILFQPIREDDYHFVPCANLLFMLFLKGVVCKTIIRAVFDKCGVQKYYSRVQCAKLLKTSRQNIKSK